MGSKKGAKPNGRERDHRETHGLYLARRMLNEFGSRAIDGRTSTGRALAEWTNAIVQDLGGEDQRSPYTSGAPILCA